ncbi:PepSY domain-containing protein [Afifella sp. IM 167]|uniref:PepSY domain-containing protein n=1 Tax=Afifella sp. IM 167 TaxID=2033586 RepID=UPI001CCBC5E3|nr:PepSY domain-containing protein [Afifella sp. IM 167]MBZ8133050.1 peptidase [Afifella sp. IM 167]
MKRALFLLSFLLAAPVLAIPLLAVPGLATPAFADGRGHDHDRAREALSRGEVLSLADILPAIEKRYEARMLEVDLEEKHGTYVYELELIRPDGKILEILVDAATGEVLRDRPHGHDGRSRKRRD